MDEAKAEIGVLDRVGADMGHGCGIAHDDDLAVAPRHVDRAVHFGQGKSQPDDTAGPGDDDQQQGDGEKNAHGKTDHGACPISKASWVKNRPAMLPDGVVPTRFAPMRT